MITAPAPGAPIDLVYTWVDDAWPGYLDQLRAQARTVHDLNPNRTRDNLELLRFSLRSVAQYAPWIRHVHLLTCRPQIPHWLATGHPALRITHHDQIMDDELLPTYNSFAIISHLHLLPGLADRFIYMEDDMLLGAPVSMRDFIDDAGRMRMRPRASFTPAASQRSNPRLSPWNLCLAQANHLLDQRFGRARRRIVNHVPLLIDRSMWADMLAEWADAARHTVHSRFRSAGGIAPEHLYPYYALARGRAARGSLVETYRDCFYFPLENWYPLNRVSAALTSWRRPKFIAMNDNFGAHPDARSVAYLRRVLQRRYPETSGYERAGAPA